VEGSGLFTYLFMAKFEVLTHQFSKGMRKSLPSKV